MLGNAWKLAHALYILVHAHMPGLLEGLLQQEIDKLKQAVEQDQRDA